MRHYAVQSCQVKAWGESVGVRLDERAFRLANVVEMRNLHEVTTPTT
jgi:hypothetical protein